MLINKNYYTGLKKGVYMHFKGVIYSYCTTQTEGICRSDISLSACTIFVYLLQANDLLIL